jgi:hypothetical protein
MTREILATILQVRAVSKHSRTLSLPTNQLPYLLFCLKRDASRIEDEESQLRCDWADTMMSCTLALGPNGDVLCPRLVVLDGPQTQILPGTLAAGKNGVRNAIQTHCVLAASSSRQALEFMHHD